MKTNKDSRTRYNNESGFYPILKADIPSTGIPVIQGIVSVPERL